MLWDYIRAARIWARLGPPRYGRGARWDRLLWYTKGRTSQAPVETLLSPTSGKGRVSQEPVEVLISPSSRARISQAPVEILVQQVNPFARLTQAPVEVLVRNSRQRASVMIID